MAKQQDGVDKLAALLPGGQQDQESQEPEPLSEEEVAEKTEEILDLVEKLADKDIFLMQDLLEACSAEIQASIRALIYADTEDDDGK